MLSMLNRNSIWFLHVFTYVFDSWCCVNFRIFDIMGV